MTLPIVEIFGPTIQGEGPLAGTPTHFVRTGYCDYRCSWCDTMYAVDPEQVRATSERLTPQQISDRILELRHGPQWVTISGGNPAIWDMLPVVDALHRDGWKISVETQGSVWRPWLASVDMLVVSPKPPSSNMVTERHDTLNTAFLDQALQMDKWRRTLKIVVFDDEDYEWAANIIQTRRNWQAFLSAGTPVTDDNPTRAILDRLRWLFERVAADERMAEVRVLPQLHVLAWGKTRGV